MNLSFFPQKDYRPFYVPPGNFHPLYIHSFYLPTNLSDDELASY